MLLFDIESVANEGGMQIPRGTLKEGVVRVGDSVTLKDTTGAAEGAMIMGVMVYAGGGSPKLLDEAKAGDKVGLLLRRKGAAVALAAGVQIHSA